MRPGGEDGFTLIELLVVLALLPVVLVALFAALDTTAKLAPRTITYAQAVGEAGNGLSRAMREIRQTYRVLGTTPNSMTFLTAPAGVATQVSISCSVAAGSAAGVPLRRCVRTAAPVGTALPSPAVGTVLVNGIANGTDDDPVFEYTPDGINPTYVRMLIKVPPGRDNPRVHPITIDDGTLLRNNALGS